MSMVHDDLVRLGVKWLGSRCPVVISELVAGSEVPDCFGYEGRPYKDYNEYGSILIECKISRSDFKADQIKFVRREPEWGTGNYRFYLVPRGLVQLSEVPFGWGLLETSGKRVQCVKHAERQESNMKQETHYLVSAFRRVKVDPEQCVSIKYYTIQTKCKATVSVKKDEGENNELVG